VLKTGIAVQGDESVESALEVNADMDVGCRLVEEEGEDSDDEIEGDRRRKTTH
jgi:hypothetical protein